jgi:hypothetical protein
MQNVEFLSRYLSFSIALVFMCVISLPEVKLFRKDIFFNAYELSMSPHAPFLERKNLYPIYTSIFCSVIPYYLSSVSENVSKSQIFS